MQGRPPPRAKEPRVVTRAEAQDALALAHPANSTTTPQQTFLNHMAVNMQMQMQVQLELLRVLRGVTAQGLIRWHRMIWKLKPTYIMIYMYIYEPLVKEATNYTYITYWQEPQQLQEPASCQGGRPPIYVTSDSFTKVHLRTSPP